jgi:pimeloyl-ACP methyl ester carboxylesterase
LVGWSDGGIIGLDLAMRHPERLTKLWAFGANTNVAGLKPGAENDPIFAAMIREAGADYRRVSPTPNDYAAFRAAVAAMWSTQPSYACAQLATIITPTMIADGEYDETITRAHTEEIARCILGAQLWIMPGVSHFAHRQNPELYDRALTRVLDSK